MAAATASQKGAFSRSGSRSIRRGGRPNANSFAKTVRIVSGLNLVRGDLQP